MAITKLTFSLSPLPRNIETDAPLFSGFPLLKKPTVFFFFNSECHSVLESSSDESHMEATQAQMTCWYSKRHCNIWAFLANWQCIFCTWYLILVEARFGVRLISWSSTIGVKPLAFIGVFWHFTYSCSFISTITLKSLALRVLGSDFLKVKSWSWIL